MTFTDIIKPGTKVKLKAEFGNNVNAVVKAVWIGENGIEYMIAYFHQGKLETPYIPREMFDVVAFRLNA